jgi:enamine deaminase RidA (YjgF/YER057c/UK114 family)|tara:strand:+ start:213 stop:1316 length:1104 start_codon:yes stop_codon:yes gene_type:complete
MVQAVEGVVFPWLDPSRYSFALGIEAEGATWLAGQTASRHDPASGRVVSGGPAAEQARICWDKIEAVLEAAGRGVGECTEVVEYLTAEGLDAQDEIVGERRASCAASTMVVDALVRPDAVLEVEVVAGGPAHQVRLPQLLPIDSDGSVVASGDLVGQCEWVLEEAGRQLAEFGLGLEHVVRTVQQTTPATRRDYRATAEARRRLLGPAFPASTGVLTSRLPHPDVLVALDVWASTAPKEIVRHAEDAYASLTFSPATVADSVVYISGTTAWDPTTGGTIGKGDVGAQAEFVYDQIRQVLEAAGGGIDDLVKTIEYVTPEALPNYRDVNTVRENVLGRPFPASTGVAINALLSSDWLIEVEAVAVLNQ